MPYIKQEDRDELNKDIQTLSDTLVRLHNKYAYDGAFAGLLNYTCTTLATQIVIKKFGKLRYWMIAIITGTFKNIADEFYRRVAVPYEDKQVRNNGDIPEYLGLE